MGEPAIDDDYELYVQRNRKIKDEFLARILLTEGLLCKPAVRERPKPKSRALSGEPRYRSNIDRIPHKPRRSERIQKTLTKIKRVKGFKGFKERKGFKGFKNTKGFSNKLVVRFPWQVKPNDVDNQAKDEDCDTDNEDDIDSDEDIDDDDNDFEMCDEIEFYESEEELSSDQDEIYVPKKKIRRRSQRRNEPLVVLSPDEISQEDIDNIARRSGSKSYSTDLGTSCHQCRQKTLDTKTICRSGHCVGVRGQFCGPCLFGRYGESAEEALMNPVWSCPPCRNLCNCSICRTRNGQRPTGILLPYVKTEGYSSVQEYLEHKKLLYEKKKG